MRKGELVATVAANTGMARSHVEAVINAALDAIVDSVAAGDRVTLTGFGSFEARSRKARTGRNPQTGEPIEIPATVSPAFTPGKAFSEAVKGS